MTDQAKDADKLAVIRRERIRFLRWWKPRTKPSGPSYGCSENWGAWQAWLQARVGYVPESEEQ